MNKKMTRKRPGRQGLVLGFDIENCAGAPVSSGLSKNRRRRLSTANRASLVLAAKFGVPPQGDSGSRLKAEPRHKNCFDRMTLCFYADEVRENLAKAFEFADTRVFRRAALPKSYTDFLGRKLFLFLLTVQGLKRHWLLRWRSKPRPRTRQRRSNWKAGGLLHHQINQSRNTQEKEGDDCAIEQAKPGLLGGIGRNNSSAEHTAA